MTRTVPLAELSMVRVANEMGVTQALIHYYLPSGRDGLTSGVMNAFYRELYEHWPELTGGWRQQVRTAAQLLYDAYVRYPGIATYVASHNRFQVAQIVEEGEPDYGLLMMERTAQTLRSAGLSADRTGVHCHLLILFIQACGQSTVTHRWPQQHAAHLNEKLASLDPKVFPNCHFIRKGLSHLDAQEAFSTGLETMIEGIASEGRRTARQRRTGSAAG